MSKEGPTAKVAFAGKVKEVPLGITPERVDREGTTSGGSAARNEQSTRSKDAVEQASQESFPASAPPSYNP